MEDKRPIGLRPKYVFLYSRINEILEAMERYSEANIPIPIEWIKELKECYEATLNS